MRETTAADADIVSVLHKTIVAMVRHEAPDLSARQLGVFLICYLENKAQTVRGLAAELNVSKPAITRALDRLSEFDLVRRKTDPKDRRSVLVQRTVRGAASLRNMRAIMIEASKTQPALQQEKGQSNRVNSGQTVKQFA